MLNVTDTMLTSAGGILALLQDNPHVKADSRAEDVSLKVKKILQFYDFFLLKIYSKSNTKVSIPLSKGI